MDQEFVVGVVDNEHHWTHTPFNNITYGDGTRPVDRYARTFLNSKWASHTTTQSRVDWMQTKRNDYCCLLRKVEEIVGSMSKFMHSCVEGVLAT